MSQAPLPPDTASADAAMVLSARIFNTLLLVLIMILFLVQFWTITETAYAKQAVQNAPKVGTSNRTNTILQALLMAQLFATLGLVTFNMVALFLEPFPYDQVDCDALTKVQLVFYMFAMQFTLLIMIAKSRVVSGFEKANKFYRKVSILVFWGVIAFIPFGLPLGMIYVKGIRTSAGRCVVFLPEMWYLIVLVVGIVGLSIALLYLFIQPLYHLYNTSDNGRVGARKLAESIKRVIVTNIWLAIVMMSVTSANIVASTAIWTLVANDPSLDYTLTYIHLGGPIDMITLCICTRMMTNVWMPNRFKARQKVMSDDTLLKSAGDPEHGHSSTRRALVTSAEGSAA